MEDIRFGAKAVYNITNVSYISVERKKGHTYEFKKGKPIMTFIYAERGQVNYIFEDNSILVREGEVLFIPQRTPYKIECLGEKNITRMIMFDFISNSEMPCFEKTNLNRSFEFADIFNSITYENTRNVIFLLSKAYALVNLLNSRELYVPRKFLKIIPGINEISKKYFENNPVSYYAELCGMGESNFRKLFKEYTGKSPIDYRNSIRIAEAKKLINSGECNVQEAAYLTGFNNMSFFYETYNKNI